ncbi:glutathione S-transferase N-terminal domain-containing protein [uncultured Tateyamaria sp.]|uniref:glutathione S-transferase N-terminal domain-containing protein n=1 Tax=uncultured Tateyamaria sp. TaxID=455651 RepID=UPI00260D270A|nr:glutathione S-transferase N-terminal domain-containing protein [uncultured Tateyamaria sp.]
MIELYYWKTSNGHKVAICLEEMELAYRVTAVDIQKDEQFSPQFLSINPNNKIPAIVDHAPSDGLSRQEVFESGAILLYLAEKTGLFLPKTAPERMEVLQWLFWQAAGFGPMLGQAHHFNRKAPDDAHYARERYNKEALHLYGVLDRRLEGRDFVAGAYSIADMMIFPWVQRHAWQNVDLNDFPAVHSWSERISARPAIQKAYALPDRLGI